MLPINLQTLCTPPSSPPSPCSTWVNSSSPPSSPVIEPLSLDDAHDDERELPRQTRLNTTIDPLAGSYNANRMKTTAIGPQKKLRLDIQPNTPRVDPQQTPKVETAAEREERLWEKALEEAFETRIRKIDLVGQGLTRILPQFILDLSKIVVLPETRETSDDIRSNWPSVKPMPPTNGRGAFKRIQTAPALPSAGWLTPTSQGKSWSSNSVLGTSTKAAQLYLGQNEIKRLPAELCRVYDLTFLSLRNNCISYLPPEIEQLQNLETLNVAGNELEYVPAELMRMKKLRNLFLFPNPFIKRPPGLTSRPVSETTFTGTRVPLLSEIALRVLLRRPITPALSSSRRLNTLLEDFYNLPLPTVEPYRPIPPRLQRILSTCVPGSISCPVKALDEYVNGVGQCPNPAHAHDLEQTIFVQPAETRYSWERKIGELGLGGEATLLWRGCQRGCLDFLGPMTDESSVRQTPIDVVDEDADVIVQTIQFESSAELDFDD
ncbi:hypothetical protein GALMADRAFT_264500 [Galerina marginata CBS 339.88]|uniref:Uncharacterized protein n=1 Tax=Galerina marginata (strain CBS 339.88) TaxID=685588 RepID=A0A067TBF9_GALM3|nr:hypothetical protein GALMADRAFT_264500 [Galerina marginata CBS 339.88]